MVAGAPRRFPTATDRDTLERFFTDQAIADYIAQQPWIVNGEYDVPDLAGYSVKPGTLYIDRLLAKDKPKIDGKSYDEWLPTLFGADYANRMIGHEVAEKAALDVWGMDYDHAHHDVALPCEHECYTRLGMDWKRGQKQLAPWIRRTELEDITKPPPDLDCRPYYQDPGQNELRILKRLAKLGVTDAQHKVHPRQAEPKMA